MDRASENRLEIALREAVARVKAMTPMEYEIMIAAQRASFVRAETMWPKPRFHYENGVKVYESYADYCA